jgi:Raf kinase inhibitor-like YbhB/YbcL family protein
MKWVLVVWALLTIGCGSKDTAPKAPIQQRLTVTSNSFNNNSAMPQKHAADHGNASPHLKWTGVPEGTRAFALVVEDPDAPTVQPFVHWVIYNIPASSTEIAEGKSAGTEGKNDTGQTGYFGPKPPPGRPHHYHFKVYALDKELELPPGASKQQVMEAIQYHVLARGELVGVYETR